MGGILVLFIYSIYIYITRLASNEIFSPSNKIHREVGRAKDLSATLLQVHNRFFVEKSTSKCLSFKFQNVDF